MAIDVEDQHSQEQGTLAKAWYFSKAHICGTSHRGLKMLGAVYLAMTIFLGCWTVYQHLRSDALAFQGQSPLGIALHISPNSTQGTSIKLFG